MNSLVLAIDKKDRSAPGFGSKSPVYVSHLCSLSLSGGSLCPKKKTRAVAWVFEIECHAALTEDSQEL